MEVQELLYRVLTNMPLMPDDNQKVAGNVSETKLFIIGETTFYCYEKSLTEQIGLGLYKAVIMNQV